MSKKKKTDWAALGFGVFIFSLALTVLGLAILVPLGLLGIIPIQMGIYALLPPGIVLGAFLLIVPFVMIAFAIEFIKCGLEDE